MKSEGRALYFSSSKRIPFKKKKEDFCVDIFQNINTILEVILFRNAEKPQSTKPLIIRQPWCIPSSIWVGRRGRKGTDKNIKKHFLKDLAAGYAICIGKTYTVHMMLGVCTVCTRQKVFYLQRKVKSLSRTGSCARCWIIWTYFKRSSRIERRSDWIWVSLSSLLSALFISSSNLGNNRDISGAVCFLFSS